jgi:hypothetical protein
VVDASQHFTICKNVGASAETVPYLLCVQHRVAEVLEGAAYGVVMDLMADVLTQVAQRRDIGREHLLAPLADTLAAVALRARGDVALPPA